MPAGTDPLSLSSTGTLGYRLTWPKWACSSIDDPSAGSLGAIAMLQEQHYTNSHIYGKQIRTCA